MTICSVGLFSRKSSPTTIVLLLAGSSPSSLPYVSAFLRAPSVTPSFSCLCSFLGNFIHFQGYTCHLGADISQVKFSSPENSCKQQIYISIVQRTSPLEGPEVPQIQQRKTDCLLLCLTDQWHRYPSYLLHQYPGSH